MGTNMKNTVISILILGLSALYSISPLLIHPEFTSGSDGEWDLSMHINRAFQVSASIKEGIIYQRWLSESNGGYGSPALIFYSPLFYWVTGFINLFIHSLIASLKIVTFIGFLFSGISMYLFLRNFCNHIGSVAGGIVYQLMPYHVFDFYMRQTLTETFAFWWLPLILHFAYKGFVEDRFSHWVGMAFSYAGLILTHIASAYLFTFVITAYALSFSIRNKKPKVLLKFILALLIGLSFSAIYFIPMYFERKFVHTEWLIKGPWGDYAHNFLFMGEKNDLHLIVALQMLLLITAFRAKYLINRRSVEFPGSDYFYFFSSLFMFSIFISTPLSMPIWKIIIGLQATHFPWRWLMFSSLATSIIIGLSLNALFLVNIKNDRLLGVSAVVFYGFLLSNVYLTSRYIMMAEPMQKQSLEWILRSGGDIGEFLPIWNNKKKMNFIQERGTSVIVFKDGGGAVDIVSWKSQYRLFTVNAVIPSIVRISTFYYPGWTALINEREVPIEIEKDSGAMLLNIPPGKSDVLLEFKDTPLRRIAKWISILSFFAALTGLIAARLKK